MTKAKEKNNLHFVIIDTPFIAWQARNENDSVCGQVILDPITGLFMWTASRQNKHTNIPRETTGGVESSRDGALNRIQDFSDGLDLKACY